MTAVPHLEYYPDTKPGIRRTRHGKGFSYFAPDGTRIERGPVRKRVVALAVPPAWEEVWICPRETGHLQATGRDVKARKQYRYHPDWSAFRDQQKFQQLAQFGEHLPSLRRRILRDLKNNEAGDHEFAVAAVLALMDRASLRVGTQDYARENGTYGASTLRSRHMRIQDGVLHLNYTGKGGTEIAKTLKDRTLNRVLTQLDDLPGPELMSWTDEDGTARAVTSGEVNAFLTGFFGDDALTAKTFRTWNGSAAALDAALGAEKPTIKSITEAAADRLNNTAAIARRSYVHPSVIDLSDATPSVRDEIREGAPDVDGLRRAEAQLLHLLKSETA